jgi:rhodanese-related sulfurtransferase
MIEWSTLSSSRRVFRGIAVTIPSESRPMGANARDCLFPHVCLRRLYGGMTPPLTAAEFFSAKLAFETDPSDLAAARAAGTAPLVIDTRSAAAWSQGRIPGAVHIPNAHLAERIGEVAPETDAAIVVYCWGPGCNGSTIGALTLTGLGYTNVRELIGGFEYWAREGLAVISDAGRSRQAPDPLTAPAVSAA